MSLPLELPLTLYRGDTYHWQFRVWADEQRTQPADLTGVIAASEIRPTVGAGVAALTVAVTLPNKVDVDLPAPLSQQLAPVPQRWDVQLTYPTGVVRTIVAGPVAVRADATQPPVERR